MRLLGPCLAVLLLATAAHAQTPPASDHDAQARQLFEVGRTAYEESRYADALAAFQQSYELSRRPALLFNIGQCQDRLRHDQAAIDAFEGYLSAVRDAPNRRDVEARLQILLDIVAHATPTPTPSDVAHHDAAPPPAPAPEHRGGSVFEEWWFWTIVGVVVIGATVAAVAVAASHTEQPPAGDVGPGGIVMALGSS